MKNEAELAKSSHYHLSTLSLGEARQNCKANTQCCNSCVKSTQHAAGLARDLPGDPAAHDSGHLGSFA